VRDKDILGGDTIGKESFVANNQIAEEKAKLVKTLRRWDLVFFGVCAIIGLDAVAGLAKWGLGQGVTWLVIFVFLFLLPYGMVTAELGAAFPAEGGIYTWARMAYGKFAGETTAILYWASNAIWIGGSLAGVTIASINSFFLKPNGHAPIGTLGSIIIGLIFVWVNIAIAVISLNRGKWAGNIGAWVKAIAVIAFAILVIASLAKHGLPVGHVSAHSFVPSITGFLAVIGSVIFLFVGFELESGASEEMTNPQHDVPVGILRSGIITAVLYVIVIMGILLALPEKELTTSSGLTGAFQKVNEAIVGTGGGAKFLGYIFGIIVILTLVGSGSVWILGSCRVQAVAALDGAAPRWLGKFGKQGTPVSMAYLSGIVGSVFVIVVFWLASLSGSGAATLNNAMAVFLGLALSTAVLAYVFTIPATITLRQKFPDVHRPFIVPGGTFGLWLCVILSELGVILTGFTLLWPGLIDNVLGHSYSIMDSWGVSRTFFELTTFGSFVLIIVVGTIFWAVGRSQSGNVAAPDTVLIEGVVEEEA
jgi:amino acid transporter